jgi:hypothetical protein
MSDSELNTANDDYGYGDYSAESVSETRFGDDPWQGMEVRQRDRDEIGTEGDPANVTLSADDAGADADLPRASRAEKQKMRRRTQLSTALPALLLIAAGVFALVRPDQVSGSMLAAEVVGLVAIMLLLRFLFNSRRERGLFFLTMAIILFAGFAAMVAAGAIDITLGWPLLVAVPGAAMIFTFLFERTHERGLLLPGIIFIIAALVLLPFSLGYFDNAILSDVALYWPVLLIVLALALLPRAVRDRAE